MFVNKFIFCLIFLQFQNYVKDNHNNKSKSFEVKIKILGNKITNSSVTKKNFMSFVIFSSPRAALISLGLRPREIKALSGY